jgi:hypothetical protein
MLQQRQIVIKALVTQLDIEHLVGIKYTITHFHSISLMLMSIIVTIYRTAQAQWYESNCHSIIMITTKLWSSM